MFYFFNCPDFAVIPSALGPIQALMPLIPYLLAGIGTFFLAIFKPKSYRALLKYCWTHKVLTAIVLAACALFFWRRALFGTKAADEKAGAAWTCFRGGPERTGAISSARGPFEKARVLWNEPNASIFQLQEINSSPAVAGNRVYFGTSIQTAVAQSGSITCLDADTGALAWRFTGEGMDRPLQAIFSSPAIGGGSSGSKDEARYLVCGEGYHKNDNSRIFCLDLARVRASGGKLPPEFKWSVETTNHVESSPAIFEDKVYTGSGDDGWWCIDLLSGKVKWHLEGNDYYVMTEGPQVEALAKLAGKTVAVDGSPTRYRPNKDDFSIMFLDAERFIEVPAGTTLVPNPAQSTKNKNLRTVIGKVVVTESANNPEQRGSRVKIEMAKVYPDAECPPVALRIDGQPRLICGSGLEGQAVIFVNAETGEEIWRTKTSDPVFSGPAVVNGQIVVGLSNGDFEKSAPNPSGAVLALAAADGRVLWQYKTSDGVLGTVAVKDNTVYACSRDGSLYVLDAKDGVPKEGKLIKKFDTGSAMVCSPAVTDLGVYMSTESGKVYCIKRDGVAFQWSHNLTPGERIVSSACATGDRLYVGTRKHGLYCLCEEARTAVHKAERPWSGAGGNAEHASIADDRGPPAVNGNKSDRITEDGKIPDIPVAGPMAACGSALYFFARTSENKCAAVCVDTVKRSEVWHSGAMGTPRAIAANETMVFVLDEQARPEGRSAILAMDSKTGQQVWSQDAALADQPILCLSVDQLIVKASKTALRSLDINHAKELWSAELGEFVGAPALKHGLLFIATTAPQAQLLCLDDSTGVRMWTAELAAKPIGGPSVSGDKVFVTVAGKSSSDAKIVCRNLTDGNAVWESDVEKAPVTPLALGGEHLAFTIDDGTVIVLDTLKGEQTHTVLLGKGGQAPSIYRDTLFLGADNRVGAYDLSTSSWLWGYRDQKTIGHVWAAPILANETVWVSTEKQGLIGIGAKEK